ncbi:MAG: hypothetical protein JAY90_15810, partial [Candidatus Thiodiazotropha lotti]|nr:hypothetical protein [Candidatus Thiodiazotropha lotti]
PDSHRLEEILGTTTDARQYDAAGNTISSLLGSYTYDDQNRMVGFSNTGTTASYGYNGKGERIRKTVDGVITRFRYGPSGALLGEYDQSGQAIREYLYLEGQPVVQLQGPVPVQVSYLHTDHLGAVVKATDGTGSVVWDSDRRPFGDRAETVAQVEMPLGFPGQYFDQETENYYNYFRDYDPATGRYLQSDPIGLEGGLNTYAYVSSNPIRFTDSSGLFLDQSGAYGVAEALASSTGVGTSTAVAGAIVGVGAAIYPPAVGAGSDQLPKQCDDEDDCELIYRQIDIAVNGLQRRYRQIRENRGNIDPTTHQEQFKGRQVHLRKLLYKATTMGCFNYRSDAWRWATRPAPKPGPRPMQ